MCIILAEFREFFWYFAEHTRRISCLVRASVGWGEGGFGVSELGDLVSGFKVLLCCAFPKP